MNPLETIAALSHEFGTEDYVRGGGGNTSVKDADTLWVKPSGATLSGMRPENFVPMSRRKLEKLYEFTPPADVTAAGILSNGVAATDTPPDDTANVPNPLARAVRT